jgi:hypothetical protein
MVFVFSEYKYMIVVDHKQELKDEHILEILRKKTNKIFLKRHPSKDKSILIWHEVERSMHQERDLRNYDANHKLY